jgi:AraC-like DNA-binding protein
MSDFAAGPIPDYLSPFTGEGVDLTPITNADLDIRPVPLSAGILGKGNSWEYEHVFSPFCRLYFARHGDMHIQAGRQSYRIPKLGFLLIPAEIHFHCETSGSSEHLWVHFKLQPPWLEGFRKPVSMESEPASRAIARSLWMRVEDNLSIQAQVHLIKGLLHLLFSKLNLAGQSSVSRPLARALLIIQNHLYKPLTVASLARQAGYSPEHLAHLFKKHLGQSPSEYIRTIRIREVARRLAYTDHTIEAIADDLCFANRHHLSRVFKRMMKEAPATFRNRIQNNSQTS